MPRAHRVGVLAKRPACATALADADRWLAVAAGAMRQDCRAGEARAHDGAVAERRHRAVDRHAASAAARDLDFEIKSGSLAERDEGEQHAAKLRNRRTLRLLAFGRESRMAAFRL
jgi:hypothetical protein